MRPFSDPRRSMRRPKPRRRTATRCPGDEVEYLTPDAYRVGMLIALSKSPNGDPLTEAQRAEVEFFMGRLLDRADTDDDRAGLRSVFEAIATATMPAVWHALGTGDEAALDCYDVERLKTETLRIVGELPELFGGVVSISGKGPGFIG